VNSSDRELKYKLGKLRAAKKHLPGVQPERIST
jgi:hypothetical protein